MKATEPIWLSHITRKLPSGELALIAYGTSVGLTKKQALVKLEEAIRTGNLIPVAELYKDAAKHD